MGNSVSVQGCYKSVTDCHCCSRDVGKGEPTRPDTSKEVQRSFYIPSSTTLAPSQSSSSNFPVNLTPNSSEATTISKSSMGEDRHNWCDIDLPPVYRPLSTPIGKPESFQRFRGKFKDRGSISFVCEHPMNQTITEIPGIHTTRNKRTLWTKAKDRIMGNQRGQMQFQSYLTKHKSDEMKPDVKEEVDNGSPDGTTKVSNGVLESDL